MNKNIIVSIIILLAGMLACAMPAGLTPTPVVITQVVVVPNEQEQEVQASPTIPPPTVPSTYNPPADGYPGIHRYDSGHSDQCSDRHTKRPGSNLYQKRKLS